MLQCVAILNDGSTHLCCSVLQCVAVCCNVLQCVAMHCSVLQCVAVCCNVLQCVAMHCSVLQSSMAAPPICLSFSPLSLSASFPHSQTKTHMCDMTHMRDVTDSHAKDSCV